MGSACRRLSSDGPPVVAYVLRVLEARKDQSWGDVVTILATTALRISEVSGLRAGDAI